MENITNVPPTDILKYHMIREDISKIKTVFGDLKRYGTFHILDSKCVTPSQLTAEMKAFTFILKLFVNDLIWFFTKYITT